MNWLIQKLAIVEINKFAAKITPGYKTKIILGFIGLFGALDAYNGYCLAHQSICHVWVVPGWVYSILAALGWYTRSLKAPT